MLGSGDNSGTVALLAGVVLVVFCGIGISLVADTRLNLGNSQSSIKKAIVDDHEKIEKLTRVIGLAEESWANHSHALGHDQRINELRDLAADNQSRLAELRIRRTGLNQALERTEANRQAYRINYRTQARADSVGEKLESLSLSDGRTYRELTIRGFDASGIRIHHEGGSARIGYAELPKSWKERYQWHPDETKVRKAAVSARAIAKEKESAQKSAESESPQSPRRDKAPGKPKGPDPAEIARIRNQFILARRSYLDASSQAAIARGKANASQKSVPGSLETWAERAVRLEQLAQRLHAGYYKARNDLANVSPRDPLLQSNP